MGLLIELIVPILLGLTGLLVGTLLERKHYRSIRAREEALRHIMVFNEKRPPLSFTGQHFHLVQGSVVVSSDYFKNIAASLKSFFGGRLTSYETLMDRGRREAILRMKEQAAAVGATAIFAVRLETSTLNSIGGRGGIGSAEFLAYGTAWSAQP
ncbi:YbjQ family protein [Lampropedia puyangensis]|uniref:YbjQ family protein n=1 Tax=Lampropedia puyangensis TaxID=1330072 RepID=A0A4S8FCL0_9BURK|nr:YbjQ family protein [Lampropedia puyangensis]THU05280.1 YbjQ family protein [Lampropedia puyangensis]